jgi:glycosyltransferase involved in cell wall biosynthesis
VERATVTILLGPVPQTDSNRSKLAQDILSQIEELKSAANFHLNLLAAFDENFSGAQNWNREIFSAPSSEILLLLPGNLKINSDFLKKILEPLLRQDTDCVWCGFFDHYPNGRISQFLLNLEVRDLSEQQNLGRIFAFRKSALKSAKVFDEEYGQAFEYELRLRLFAEARCLAIEEPLYAIQHYEEPAKFPGYRYLRYNPNERREIELIFQRAATRQNIWMTEKLNARRLEMSHGPIKATVIVPTYKRDPLLYQSLESLCASTEKAFEVIVVDNAHSSKTRELALSFRDRGLDLRYFSTPQNSVPGALNVGTMEARASYILLLDSDDLYLPDAIGSTIEAFDANPHWGMAISYYSRIDAGGKPMTDFGVITHDEFCRNQVLRTSGAGSLRAWRKSAFLEIGGYTHCRYGEDYEFAVRMSESFEIGRIHKVLYLYRNNAEGMSSRINSLLRAREKSAIRARAFERRRILCALEKLSQREKARSINQDKYLGAPSL